MGDRHDPWAAHRPPADRPWDERRAAHLLRRAGFGASAADVRLSVERGLDDTVDWLLDVPEAPGGFEATLRRAAGELALDDELEALRGRWVDRMVRTPYPLLEKMTLFWHDHFATSLDKVAEPRLMADQNDTLRRHALGDFGELLRAVSRDPAMIEWLDNQRNARGAPNENFAREVMELFTLGPGHYTEADVQEAARAFTGWHRVGRSFRFDRARHDDGVKTVLGRSGRLGGDDVLSILLAQERTATFLATKLVRWFVVPDPEPGLVGPLADALRRGGYRIRPILERILRSNVFHSEIAYKSLVKSPAEFVIGSVLALGVKARPLFLAGAMARMGQELFYPPDVSGWEGHRAWINATTLLERSRFALDLSRARGQDLGTLFDPTIGLPLDRGPDALVDHLLARLVQDEVPVRVRRRLRDFARTLDGGAEIAAGRWAGHAVDKARGLVHLVLSLPEANLS